MPTEFPSRLRAVAKAATGPIPSNSDSIRGTGASMLKPKMVEWSGECLLW